MSNNFPAVPGDLLLASLSYLAILPTVTIQAGSSLDFGAGVNSQLNYTAPNMGTGFTFVTPGTFGTFDQDAFETLFKSAITAIATVLSSMSGVALATVKAEVIVRRNWSWTDGSGFLLTWQDQMSYP